MHRCKRQVICSCVSMIPALNSSLLGMFSPAPPDATLLVSAFRCVIASMCAPNLEFQLVNPTTQVALFTLCVGSCSSLLAITWNIYQGLNGSTTTMQWTLFNQTSQFENVWFFGNRTNDLPSIRCNSIDSCRTKHEQFHGRQRTVSQLS